MKRKIVGILVVTLLITTTLPVVSAINKTINRDIKQINESQNQDFIPGEIIVKFKEKSVIESHSVCNLFEKHQIKSMEKVFKNSENTILENIYLLKIPKDSDIFSIIEDFSSCPYVEYAETNGLSQTACFIPDDVEFSKQWALENTGQTGGKVDSDIDATEVWDIETGSSDIVISVIDSGIDYNHPDLEDNIWSNEDEIPDNDIDDDGNGFVDDIIGWDWWYDDNDPLDDMGHGTPCAGIAGAVGNNGIGGAGVCWDCKIMPLKIMNDTGWTYFIDIAKSIEYAADNGADVISLSLRIYDNKSYILNAVNYAYGKGVVLVAGAGNENISTQCYPAAYNNVIAVGGTDHNDNRMHYYCEECQQYHGSNFGPWVDVAAPAVDIFSTMPTYHVWFNDIFELEQNYDIMPEGNSFATPHVSGVAALMLSKDSSLSPDIVKSLIRNNVDPYDSNLYIGTGRVNAHKALLASDPPTAPTMEGETNGDVGKEYDYDFTSTDPNNDNISEYIVNWGDGPDEIITGPFESGEQASASHKWTSAGDYTITAKAKDINGIVGPEETLDVTMPRNRLLPNTFLMHLFERFPNLFPIIRQILGL